MHVKSHAQELTHVSTKPKATRENMYIMTVQNMTAQEKYLSALPLYTPYIYYDPDYWAPEMLPLTFGNSNLNPI